MQETVSLTAKRRPTSQLCSASEEALLLTYPHDGASITQNRVAPHETLPFEILSDIFVLCAMEHLSLPPQKHEPRFLITRVCSTWRAIALATPQLWNDILLLTPLRRKRMVPLLDGTYSLIPEPDPPFPHLQLCQSLLSRSIGPNLHMRVSNFRHGWPYDLLEDIVLPSATRLKSLRIFLSREQLDRFSSMAESFVALEELDIGTHQDGTDGLTWDQPNRVFPALKRLMLQAMPMFPTFSHFPLGQLTKLRFNSPISSMATYVLLSACTSLQHLKLHLSPVLIFSTHLHDDAEINLPHLQSLELYVHQSADYSSFLNLWSCPQLTNLEFNVPDNAYPSQELAFTQLISRSPELKALWIDGLAMNPSFKLDSLVQEAKKLERLTVGPCGSLCPRLFEGIIKGNDSGGRVKEIHAGIFDFKPFEDALDSLPRLDTTRDPMKVVVYRCLELNNRQKEKVERYRNIGIDFDILLLLPGEIWCKYRRMKAEEWGRV